MKHTKVIATMLERLSICTFVLLIMPENDFAGDIWFGAAILYIIAGAWNVVIEP